MKTRPNIHIHQIFYNEATRVALDPDFIPLDNTANQRPDWYEFWVILQYLRTHELQPNNWYGFVSPNFRKKTAIAGSYLSSLVAGQPEEVDALVVPTFFDQTALFVNQFEQAETVHKGIIAASEAFLRPLGYNLAQLVSHSSNSAYSNFVIAKPTYWKKWHELAEMFFTYCEAPDSPLGNRLTTYLDGHTVTTPMKVFIQERLSSVILFFSDVVCTGIDLGDKSLILVEEWRSRPRFRRLQAMDHLKQAYCASKNTVYLEAFAKLRADIRSLPGPPARPSQ